jgi:hypothetical protein
MTSFVFANNVNTTLAAPITSTATTITLSSAVGLPASIPAGFVLAITLSDAATRSNFEIVYATAQTITGAVLVVARAQEGTAALAWNALDFAYNGDTAAQMGACLQTVQFPSSLTTSGWKRYPDPNSPTGFFIEQWGTAATFNQNTIIFPIAFPNACLNVVGNEANANVNAWGIGEPTVHGVSGVTKTGFTHWTLQWVTAPTNGWISKSNSVFYRAIGY